MKSDRTKPSWTMIKDGVKVEFKPRPLRVLWSKIKNFKVFQ